MAYNFHLETKSRTKEQALAMEGKRGLHLKVRELCGRFAAADYREIKAKTEKEDGGQLVTPKFSE